MALPIIATALGALMRRYGLKGLSNVSRKQLTVKARRQAEVLARKKSRKGVAKENQSFVRRNTHATEEDVARRLKTLRAGQVAGNIAADVGSASLIAGSFADGSTIDKFKSREELRSYIKRNKPRVWKRFMNSPYDDIKEFLKAEKGQ